MRPYLVFMCPRCRHFTTAPLGQKRRMCSYCGKIIDISKASTALFDSPEAAAQAVRLYNAGESSEFQEAVERTRDRIRHLLPPEGAQRDEIPPSGADDTLPSGKTQRLLLMLQDLAQEQPCGLDKIEEACPRYGLQWNWVERQIEKMISSGDLFSPRPWTVRYIGSGQTRKKRQRREDVTKTILALVREHGGSMSVQEIVTIVGSRNVPEDAILDSLDRLLNEGWVFEPRKGIIKIVKV